MADLRKRRVLITGASKGLGRAMAEAFAVEGANLLLSSRSTDLLRQQQKDLSSRYSIQCDILSGDITQSAVVETLIETAESLGVNTLVNNAGLVSIDALENASPERIRALVELNLLAPILLTRGLLPGFKDQENGLIININSMAGKKPATEHTVYTATKFGLRGFAEALREETRQDGIRILNVYPGKMKTNLFNDDEKSLDNSSFMPPEEIAAAIMDLLKMDPRCCPTELVVERAKP